MKFSTISLVVVLALAHGIESGSLVKRDAQAEIEKLTNYFHDLSATLTSTTHDLVEKVKTHELTDKAQAYLQEGKAHLEPLAGKVQEHLKHIEEQLKPIASQIEEQLKPLTESVQARVKPLADSVQTQLEDLWKMVTDQVKALAPPQA